MSIDTRTMDQTTSESLRIELGISPRRWQRLTDHGVISVGGGELVRKHRHQPNGKAPMFPCTECFMMHAPGQEECE